MRWLYRIGCLFGHHYRQSRRYIWYDGNHYRCECRGCLRELRRDRHGWHLAEPEGAKAEI